VKKRKEKIITVTSSSNEQMNIFRHSPGFAEASFHVVLKLSQGRRIKSLNVKLQPVFVTTKVCSRLRDDCGDASNHLSRKVADVLSELLHLLM